MPLERSFSQGIELKSQSPDVAKGVCMVMSYYVCKRMLAGLARARDMKFLAKD